jgi:hypothetical protein
MAGVGSFFGHLQCTRSQAAVSRPNLRLQDHAPAACVAATTHACAIGEKMTLPCPNRALLQPSQSPMKPSPTPLLLALALHAVSSVSGQAPTTNTVNEWKEASGLFTAVAGTLVGCTAETDAFPDKAKVAFAGFAVEYKKTYKIVTNKNTMPELKYLLWQRGCPKPAEADSTDYSGVFEVPLRSVAVTSSTYFGAFDFMGERTALRLIIDNQLYTNIPCMHKQVADQHTLLRTTKWDAKVGYHVVTNGVKFPVAELNDLKIEASFSGCFVDDATQKCQIKDTSHVSALHPGLVTVSLLVCGFHSLRRV